MGRPWGGCSWAVGAHLLPFLQVRGASSPFLVTPPTAGLSPLTCLSLSIGRSDWVISCVTPVFRGSATTSGTVCSCTWAVFIPWGFGPAGARVWKCGFLALPLSWGPGWSLAGLESGPAHPGVPPAPPSLGFSQGCPLGSGAFSGASGVAWGQVRPSRGLLNGDSSPEGRDQAAGRPPGVGTGVSSSPRGPGFRGTLTCSEHSGVSGDLLLARSPRVWSHQVPSCAE